MLFKAEVPLQWVNDTKFKQVGPVFIAPCEVSIFFQNFFLEVGIEAWIWIAWIGKISKFRNLLNSNVLILCFISIPVKDLIHLNIVHVAVDELMKLIVVYMNNNIRNGEFSSFYFGTFIWLIANLEQ